MESKSMSKIKIMRIRRVTARWAEIRVNLCHPWLPRKRPLFRVFRVFRGFTQLNRPRRPVTHPLRPWLPFLSGARAGKALSALMRTVR